MTNAFLQYFKAKKSKLSSTLDKKAEKREAIKMFLAKINVSKTGHFFGASQFRFILITVFLVGLPEKVYRNNPTKILWHN